jgi:hypothetical protein
MPKAAVVASGIGLAGQFRRTPEGTQLVIRPGSVLQHSPVSPAVCDGVLKYALPVLSEVTWVDGDLSLELDECLIDLDQPERSEVEGRIRIHDIGAGLKSPLARELGMTVAKLLGRDGADRIKLADNSTVEFQLRDGRVTHEGLKFGLPEISPELQIASSGSVGLDETLDLIIEIPLPLSMLSEGPIASALGSQTLKFPVRGTLDEPEIRFEKSGLIDGLLTNLAEQLNDGETPLLELLEQVRQRRQELKQRREANANDRVERRPPGTRQRPGLLPGLLDRLRRSGTDNTATE